MRTLAEIKGLCPCVKCGGKNAFLMANARNYFQVRCLECGNRTEWLNKVDAVITWFNMYIEAIDKDIAQKRGYKLSQKDFRKHRHVNNNASTNDENNID